jgi:UDP-4-amino-4,6-dideoxy-N-acetyl-beta-L-altrosamine N-acetyltransferase
MENNNKNDTRLRLRALNKADVPIFLQWRNDPEIRTLMLGNRFPVTAELEEAWFNERLNDRSNKIVYFTIETLNEKSPIGFIHLSNIDWISRTAMLGITIGNKNFHNKGYGSEAIGILLKYAFNELNIRKIYLEVVSFNERARKTYSSLGFSDEGTKIRHVYYNNEWHDIHLMALFNDAYNH